VTVDGVELRSGFTTGTCAAAAAAAAARMLAGEPCEAVDVELPDGERITLAVEAAARVTGARARAAVIKDAGDDPDVTDGMSVVVEVERVTGVGDTLEFAAGEGVGTVTRAGLQVQAGEPAINPVPRAMIAAAVRAVLPDGPLRLTVSVPGGREVAARTFNGRLGIEGGLSILGTSGRVIPKSEDAWLRSLLPQVDVAVAEGRDTVYLTPGGFGERAAREVFGAAETQIVQCSNFVGALLDHCVDSGIRRVVLVGHAGKLVKVAAGVWNTHSRVADARLETLAALAAAAGAAPPLVAELLDLPTIEAAVERLSDAGLADIWDDVAGRAARRAEERAARRAGDGPHPHCDCAVVDYSGAVLGRSAGLRAVGGAEPGPAARQPAATTRTAVTDAGPVERGLALTVVGVGPGAREWLTPAAWRVIRGAEVVVGGRRQLEHFAPAGAERVEVAADMTAVAAALRSRAGRRLVVLASGDPGFFGISATLRRLLPEARIETLPGISAAQLAAARLGHPWDDLCFASAHGLDVTGVVAAVAGHPRVLALADSRRSPQAIAAAVSEVGIEATVTVLERLGEKAERITSGDADEIAAGEFDGLSVVFIQRKEPA
jgi:cobalt-precorrin-5B (C1)-methyltransferase